MSPNVNSLVAEIRKREQERQQAASINQNENILKLKADNNYALRLLWLPPFKSDRMYPMISQYVHHVYRQGEGESRVYCPTSPYLLGDTPEGFKCPICKEVFALYKEIEKSPSAKSIVNTFRRTLQGFIPVYVVSGPTEDVGKVRILQYTKSFHDYFYSQIFGIAPKKNKNSKNNEEETEQVAVDEPLNSEAFMYLDNDGNLVTEGYNFIINVTTQKVPINGKMTEVNKYDMKFARKMTDVDGLNAKVFERLNEMIKFDEDFYKSSTNEELVAFKSKYMSQDNDEDEQDDEQDDDVSSDINKILNKNQKVGVVKKATKTKEEDESNENQEEDEDHIDVGQVGSAVNEDVEEVDEVENEEVTKPTTRKKAKSTEPNSKISEDPEDVDAFIRNLINN